MKVARLIAPYTIHIDDMKIPDMGNFDVLVRVINAGICGTDYSIYTGENSFVKNGSILFPMTLGHEWAGVVEKIGKNTKKFSIGDRVVGDGVVSCGICYECISGRYMYCDNLRCVGTVNTWDGAFAEYIVMPERSLYKIPECVSFEEAALVEPAATALNSVQKAGIKPGDVVVVQGTGPIGLAAVQLAKIAGAACVILSGRKDFKLSVGKNMGADVTVNILHENLEKSIMSITNNKGANVIIEASGSVDALMEATRTIRVGGVISVVAFYDKKVDGLDIDNFVLKDVSLISVVGSPGCSVPILELMRYGRVDFKPIITHKYGFNKIAEVFSEMKIDNGKKIKVMLDMNGSKK